PLEQLMDLFREHPARPPFEVPSGEGYSIEPLDGHEGFRIFMPHGELIYIGRFFDQKVSDHTVEYLQENDTVDWKTAAWKDIPADELANIRFKNIRWKQDLIRMYGKRMPLPRLTSWYGDCGRIYTYSGITSVPNAVCRIDIDGLSIREGIVQSPDERRSARSASAAGQGFCDVADRAPVEAGLGSRGKLRRSRMIDQPR